MARKSERRTAALNISSTSYLVRFLSEFKRTLTYQSKFTAYERTTMQLSLRDMKEDYKDYAMIVGMLTELQAMCDGSDWSVIVAFLDKWIFGLKLHSYLCRTTKRQS